MNLKLELPSLDILQIRVLYMFALFGHVLMSYAYVVILSFPFLSPISLLYKSNSGMTIFCCLMFFPELSLIWWIIGALSSFRSIYINSSSITFLKFSHSVTLRLMCVKNPMEYSLCVKKNWHHQQQKHPIQQTPLNHQH